jgi:serine/threonine protein kinase
MVTKDGRAKLIDLGLSRKIVQHLARGTTSQAGIYGTALYISPEACDGRGIGTLSEEAQLKCDVYSFGLLAFEVFSLTSVSRLGLPEPAHRHEPPTIPPGLCSAVESQLIRECCDPDAARRLPMTEASTRQCGAGQGGAGRCAARRGAAGRALISEHS